MSDICVCGHSWGVHFAAQCANCFCKRKRPTNEDALTEAQEILTALVEYEYGPEWDSALWHETMERAQAWLHSRGVTLSYEKEDSK